MSEPLVTLAVCTRKRPEMVVRCLRSLIAQQTSFAFDIVVVENDVQQAARAAIESLIPEAAEKGIELRYFCEPEQNISIARNRCAAECRGEFLACLDDDEWAEADWVEQFVLVQQETDADAVCGHLAPVFEDGFPEYMKKTQWTFADVPEKTEMYKAPGGCMLFKKSTLCARTPPYDLNFGKTGGEDVDFSIFLTSQGKKIVKTYRAIIYEIQPLSRGKMRWCWERAFRTSLVGAAVHRRYYYCMNGARVNFKYFCMHAWLAIKNLPWLLIHPQQAMLIIGIHLAQCLGIIAYYLGVRKEGYQ